jgi:hypothetical protein
MPNIFQSLLLVIANAARNDQARMIQYLKVENEVLRSKAPGRETRRVFVTPATYHPNEAWVCEQARAFVKHARKQRLGVSCFTWNWKVTLVGLA